MTKDELFENIEKIIREGLHNDEEYIKVLEIIGKLNELDLNKEEKAKLVINVCDINILYMNFLIEKTPNDDYENLINYRGKLIKIYKAKERLCKDSTQQMEIRKTYIEELKKHKIVLKRYKKNSIKKIPITKKLALTIQDISKSIEIFMKEKDIVNKAKRIIKDTSVGVTGSAIFMSILAVGMNAISPIPIITFDLSFLVSMCPTVAYIGLSSLIRNIGSRTEFQEYLYRSSEEYKNLIETFQKENMEAIEEIVKLKQAASELLPCEEKLQANNLVIEKIRELIEKAKVPEIQEGFELEVIGLLRENKDIREIIKDNYEEGFSNDKELYNRNNRELKKLNIELFFKENSIKEAFKQAGNNFAKSFTVILMAKAILSSISPMLFGLYNVWDLGEPLLISAINNLLDIPFYPNKRKFQDTSYDNKKRIVESENILEMLNDESIGISLA